MLTNLLNFGAIAALLVAAPTVGCNAQPRNAEARTALVDSAQGRKPAPSAQAPAAAAAPTDQEKLADLSRIMGDVKAPIWVIVMSDFQCPSCKAWHDEIFEKFKKEFVTTGKARFAYVNFPLRNHRHSIPAAEAAMCAGVQGKFWPMQDAIFATQEEWAYEPSAEPYFEKLAQKSGVDMGKYRSCIQSHTTLALIKSDYQRGLEAGVDGTPTIFVRSGTRSRVMNRLSLESLREAINAMASGK